MQFRLTLVVAATGLLLMTGSTIAETAQQAKMKSCSASANEKALKGEARQAFMKTCLSGNSAAAAPATAQREKMKTCNAEATAKALKGTARRDFMKTCLSAK